jgi:hypothetical protein
VLNGLSWRHHRRSSPVRSIPHHSASPRTGFRAKESGEGGDPHRKVLGRRGLCTRLLDDGRSSSSFNNGIGRAPVILPTTAEKLREPPLVVGLARQASRQHNVGSGSRRKQRCDLELQGGSLGGAFIGDLAQTCDARSLS